MNKYIFKCIDTSSMYEFYYSCYATDQDEAIKKFSIRTPKSVVYTDITIEDNMHIDTN